MRAALVVATKVLFCSILFVGWIFVAAGLVEMTGCALSNPPLRDCRTYGCAPGLECQVVADVARCFPEWEYER